MRCVVPWKALNFANVFNHANELRAAFAASSPEESFVGIHLFSCLPDLSGLLSNVFIFLRVSLRFKGLQKH